MTSIDIGLSMAGLIAVLINIAVLVTDVDIEVTGGICFITVSGMALLGIILLSILQRNHFYQYYTNLPQTTNPDMVLKQFLNRDSVSLITRLVIETV